MESSTMDEAELIATASYRITFTAVMDDTVDTSVHLTKFVAVTHQMSDVFWVAGGLATEGLRQIAERGRQSPADEELAAKVAIGSAETIILAPQAIWHPKNPDPVNRPSSYNGITFTVSRDHPYFSFASMIGPSPDWFVGVANLPLVENDQFIKTKTVNLYAYDAGTKGSTEETLPRAPISTIAEPAISAVLYATLTLERID